MPQETFVERIEREIKAFWNLIKRHKLWLAVVIILVAIAWIGWPLWSSLLSTWGNQLADSHPIVSMATSTPQEAQTSTPINPTSTYKNIPISINSRVIGESTKESDGSYNTEIVVDTFYASGSGYFSQALYPEIDMSCSMTSHVDEGNVGPNGEREHEDTFACLSSVPIDDGGSLFSFSPPQTPRASTTAVSCPYDVATLGGNSQISGGQIGVEIDVCSEAEENACDLLVEGNAKIINNAKNIVFQIVSCPQSTSTSQ